MLFRYLSPLIYNYCFPYVYSRKAGYEQERSAQGDGSSGRGSRDGNFRIVYKTCSDIFDDDSCVCIHFFRLFVMVQREKMEDRNFITDKELSGLLKLKPDVLLTEIGQLGLTMESEEFIFHIDNKLGFVGVGVKSL